MGAGDRIGSETTPWMLGRPDMAEEEVNARYEDGATAKKVFGNVVED